MDNPSLSHGFSFAPRAPVNVSRETIFLFCTKKTHKNTRLFHVKHSGFVKQGKNPGFTARREDLRPTLAILSNTNKYALHYPLRSSAGGRLPPLRLPFYIIRTNIFPIIFYARPRAVETSAPTNFVPFYQMQTNNSVHYSLRTPAGGNLPPLRLYPPPCRRGNSRIAAIFPTTPRNISLFLQNSTHPVGADVLDGPQYALHLPILSNANK